MEQRAALSRYGKSEADPLWSEVARAIGTGASTGVPRMPIELAAQQLATPEGRRIYEALVRTWHP